MLFGSHTQSVRRVRRRSADTGGEPDGARGTRMDVHVGASKVRHPAGIVLVRSQSDRVEGVRTRSFQCYIHLTRGTARSLCQRRSVGAARVWAGAGVRLLGRRGVCHHTHRRRVVGRSEDSGCALYRMHRGVLGARTAAGKPRRRRSVAAGGGQAPGVLWLRQRGEDLEIRRQHGLEGGAHPACTLRLGARRVLVRQHGSSHEHHWDVRAGRQSVHLDTGGARWRVGPHPASRLWSSGVAPQLVRDGQHVSRVGRQQPSHCVEGVGGRQVGPDLGH
mmetsp:Transcript_20372/g.50668  ORF Transcript_20372/g.50668 Transcript_20372/m.50668 type:complete len:276 (-) Transcript_20372:754-1581(-)